MLDATADACYLEEDFNGTLEDDENVLQVAASAGVQQSDISLLDADISLLDQQQSELKPNRRVVYAALAGVALCVLVLLACLTIPSGITAASSRPLLLQLAGESDLNRLSEAISCPPGACILLESAEFAGVPAALWLMSMNTNHAPVQARFSQVFLHRYFCDL